MNSAERSWHFVLARAFREKNFVFITNIIRGNVIAVLPPSQRDFLADTILGLLTGKITYPKNQPPSTKARALRENVGARLFELESSGVNHDAAVFEVSREAGKSEPYVWDVRKDLVAADKFNKEITKLQIQNAHPGEFEKAIRDYLNSSSKPAKPKRRKVK